MILSTTSPRSRFFLKALLFSSTTILPLAIGKLIPLEWYSFRMWEVLVDHRPVAPGPFYPSQHVRMTEVGDLGVRTPLAVEKRVEWYTDAFGFRNRPSSDGAYDVVVVGDSFVAGTSLSQDETLGEVLAAKSGLRVYSYASGLDRFMREARFEQQPPRAVVYVQVERNLHKLDPLPRDPHRAAEEAQLSTGARFERLCWRLMSERLGIALDRVEKKPLLTSHLYRTIRHRSANRAVANPQAKLLFLADDWAAARLYQAQPAEQVAKMVSAVADYDAALAGRGIRLVFVPVPDKSDIYWDLVPKAEVAGLRKPDILAQLALALQRSGLSAVDLHAAYERSRAQGIAPYHRDDSHWAPAGVVIAAELLARRLRQLGLDPGRRTTLLVRGGS